MSEERICSNPECLESFQPNVKGANKEHCSRCYAYARRHEGALPGPRAEQVPSHNVTVRVPDDFEERLKRLTDAKPARWAREVVTRELDALEKRR